MMAKYMFQLMKKVKAKKEKNSFALLILRLSMSKGISLKKQDGSKLKIGVVQARWNHGIVEDLFIGCTQALLDSGVKQKNIVTLRCQAHLSCHLWRNSSSKKET